MKNALFTLGIAALLLGIASPIQAHVGDAVVRIFELTDEELQWIDLHDGSVEDWQEVMGDPTLTALDFVTDGRRANNDPSDLAYRIWMGWHKESDRIYVAMERVDDRYVGYVRDVPPESDSWYAWWSDSGLQFLVDGDHSGGAITVGMREDNREIQHFMAASESYRNFEGVNIMQNGFTYKDDWFRVPPLAEVGGGSFGEQPTVVVTEFYVTPFDWLVWDDPELAEVSDLKAGQIIGFAMVIIDYDEVFKSGSIEYQSVHSFPIDSMGPGWVPDLFGDAILVNALGKVPEDTAVENLTWARIKASFTR
jgi:hypothetical protein